VSGWGKPTSKGHYLPTVRSDIIEALYLLQMGDAWGAEIICQSLSKDLITDAKPSDKRHIELEETTGHQKQKHFLADILICLGEARLLLHQQSYNSIMNRFSSKHPDSIMEALLNTQILSSLDKLYSAKASFETAVSLDPMNPRARSSLGLTLLLLGTRSTTLLGATEEDQSRVERSALNLLFDATLHLNAAVTITESWVDRLQRDALVSPIFQAIDKTMHVTALYNNALAHLALGDHNAALRLLRRVHDSLCSKEISKRLGERCC
jgi:tetratricopeptide (TPR) repeat protein